MSQETQESRGKKPLEINDRIWQDGQIEYRYAKSGAFF